MLLIISDGPKVRIKGEGYGYNFTCIGRGFVIILFIEYDSAPVFRTLFLRQVFRAALMRCPGRRSILRKQEILRTGNLVMAFPGRLSNGTG